jgi:hypothetical protein
MVVYKGFGHGIDKPKKCVPSCCTTWAGSTTASSVIRSLTSPSPNLPKAGSGDNGRTGEVEAVVLHSSTRRDSRQSHRARLDARPYYIYHV